MQSLSTIPTVRAKPSHSSWVPSQGQDQAVTHLTSSRVAALWADPGAGKTSITLAAFCALRDAEIVSTMLVVAPLRVCQLVWRQEAQKWSEFRHLKVALLHGPKKDDVLRAGLATGDVDVYLINYEGLDWLCDLYYRRDLPFDVVVADEITKLKAHDSKRAKKLRATTKHTPYKWGLTGTPIPNGYMDLFGQFLWLDGGAALSQFITHFRDAYFKADYNGWNYVLQAGGAERIEARVAPYVLRLAYDAMPMVPDIRMLEFDKESLIKYREMQKEMLIELPEGDVTAANAAAVQQKLSQMANGAVYYVDESGHRRYAEIHDIKLDALADLIEEMNGHQLLIAYEFGHDLERIQKRFPGIPVLTGSADKIQQLEDDWNSGKTQLILAHPASVGHGLNMQKSSANHICWFSATWNLEHWDQLIRRLRRQGSKADHIVNHVFAVRGTIDELKLEALDGKDVTQARLLQVLPQMLEGTDGYRSGKPVGLGQPAREDSEARDFAEGVRNAHAGPDQRGAGDGEERGGHDLSRATGGHVGPAEGAGCDAREQGTSEGGDRDRVPQDTGGGKPDSRATDGKNPGVTTMTIGLRLPTKQNIAPEPATARPAIKGWPTAQKPAEALSEAPVAQRAAIASRVATPPVAANRLLTPQDVADAVVEHQDPNGLDGVEAPVNARSFFSPAVQSALAEGGQEAEAPTTEVVAPIPSPSDKPKRARKAAELPEQEETPTLAATPVQNLPTGNTGISGQHLTVNISGDAATVMRMIRAMANA